jgi:hypothetical protein
MQVEYLNLSKMAAMILAVILWLTGQIDGWFVMLFGLVASDIKYNF